MLDEKVVSTEEGAKLAKEFNMEFWEASAKNDVNVEQSFISLAKSVKDRLVKDGVGGPVGGGKSGAFKATNAERKKTANGCC